MAATRGDDPSTRPTRCPERVVAGAPRRTSVVPADRPTLGGRRSRSAIIPTVPTTGVGSMSTPPEVLYSETLPPTTGTDSARHASAMPSMASLSCHMTSGCSGLPKLRQFTRPSGSAPTQARFITDSATTAAVPERGSRRHQRWLPSVVRASPRPVGTPVRGSLSRNTVASPPGPSTVLRNSWWSYCDDTHDVSASRPSRSSFGSAGASSASAVSAAASSRSAGGASGRW